MTGREELDPEADRPTESALSVLRRGLAITPELRSGLLLSVVMAVFSAIGKLAIPLLVQVSVDRGLQSDQGVRAGFIAAACSVTAVLVVVVFALSRAAFVRLVERTEATLYGLRVRTFEHVHRLSIAEHNESRRGVIVARVTSDVEQLAKFFEWGGMSWIINTTLIVGSLLVMVVVSWQLTVAIVLVFVPLLPLLRAIQVRQLAAYSALRTRVGLTVGEFSEAIGGAQLIRAYGLEERARGRLRDAVTAQLRARMRAVRYFAVLFTLGDLFSAIGQVVVIVLAVTQGSSWGLGLGEVLAFVFLVGLVSAPVGELSEILDQTQIALAGWQKILQLLDRPIDIVEPEPGVELAAGPLSVETIGLSFTYGDGVPVLREVDVSIPAGATVAVVGETGSGKTTFAKLLVRLADPEAGSIVIGGHDLRSVSAASRRRSIRMVPQDGFLFDTTIRENVRYGNPGASDDEVMESFCQLGLQEWVTGLPQGLDTEVGERGESLSVGERQLVALARAQLADPGLLILDEATSAVDSRTEQALAGALAVLAEGRTTISVAHRLSTAEAADLVLVFDAGELVQVGTHAKLAVTPGVYAGLYQSWLGNVRAAG